jgi:hypothetical protein
MANEFSIIGNLRSAKKCNKKYRGKNKDYVTMPFIHDSVEDCEKIIKGLSTDYDYKILKKEGDRIVEIEPS